MPEDSGISRQAIREPTWVFGYGSLIWKQDFPYIEKQPARIRGWARRFWQGSHDHRGDERNPGRVVTLIEAPRKVCDGIALLVEPEVFSHLDYREKNGYQRVAVDIQMQTGPMTGVTYRATEYNTAFLGPAAFETMAAQINRCRGPSGSNRAYVLELADALRRLNAQDEHVFELEHWVLGKSNDSFQANHDHVEASLS